MFIGELISFVWSKTYVYTNYYRKITLYKNIIIINEYNTRFFLLKLLAKSNYIGYCFTYNW